MGGTGSRVWVRAAGAVALVVGVGALWSPAASAKTPKPSISGFAASPATVVGPSGDVAVAASTAAATSCSFTATGNATFLSPAVASCSSGAAAATLFVPQDTGRKPVKVHVVLAATGPGGTRKAKLVVTISPGAGGRSRPGPPTGVAATSGDGSASVSFTPPASDGGTAVTGYTVTATDLTTAARGGQTATGTSSPIAVTGLTGGDTYELSVTATNAVGTGPSSAASGPVVPVSVPGPPTGVVATAGAGSASVSFTPPASDGGTAVTGYTVTATDLTTAARGGQTTTGTSSPLAVTGLTGGDIYEFSVTATNAVGTGPSSAASGPVVPTTVPVATDVVAVPGDGQATVSFTAPYENGPATDEVVARDVTDAANGGQSATGQSPVTVTGLTDGDTYTFTVTVVLGGVTGPASAASNTVVPVGGLQGAADGAVVAGEQAYLSALETNPDLTTCTTASTGSGLCTGFRYGVWVPVPGSTGAYYAVGNPQPTFDPATHALSHLGVEVSGAAADPATAGAYVFEQETLTVDPTDGPLQHVWWSNYESYNPNGDYSACNYNWSTFWNPLASDFSSDHYSPGIAYNIDNLLRGGSVTCSPVYFGPADELSGPVYSNDSLFVVGNGSPSVSPSFGTAVAPSAVTTADPNCLFVDDTHGMNGSPASCASATGDVARVAPQADPNDCAVVGVGTSSCNHALEPTPAFTNDLKRAAQLDGCLYEGPTRITLAGDQMTVRAPDGAGPLDPGNTNTCPTDGTAPLPANGAVFVDTVTPNAQNTNWVPGANPLDDLLTNTVTNVSVAGSSTLTITATVTSASPQLTDGTSVGFSSVAGGQTSPLAGCAAQPLGNVTPVGADFTATATCTVAAPAGTVSSYQATTTTGSSVSGSTGQWTTTVSYSPTTSYGPSSQVAAGGCSGCYFGQTASPDTEGDAFVNGHLSGQLTIGTANDTVVDGNITYDDCPTDPAGHWATGQSGSDQAQLGLCALNVGTGVVNDSLGLVAAEYVEIDHPVDHRGNVLASCGTTASVLCDPSTTDAACTSGTRGLTVDAALLAANESVVVNNYQDGGTEGCLTVYGSVGQFARGPVGTFSSALLVSGYVKQYTWDPLLGYLFPPEYLNPGSWAMTGVDASAGSTDSCPALTGAFAGIGPGGLPEAGPPVTGSCANPSGGLPGYP